MTTGTASTSSPEVSGPWTGVSSGAVAGSRAQAYIPATVQMPPMMATIQPL